MRKNILIMGHSYATQFIDINNQYTCLFDKNKYEVTVAYLTGKPDDEIRKRTTAENVLFLNIPKSKVRYLKIGAIRTLLTLCREKKFEIVICHRYKPTYIMWWVAQFHHIPAMIFVTHELTTMLDMGKRFLIAALYRKNMLFAGVSNAVSNVLRKICWRVPEERITTLYNMIDIDMTEPYFYSKEEAREKLGLLPTDFVFGNVARLAPNKDQSSLLQAFSSITSHCPNIKLILIGDGVYEDRLKAQVKELGLEESVIFTGYLNGAFRYMKAFDCFTLSSVQEAFGRVLLEAMVAKLPIIGTHVHGIPEVIGDAGIIVQPRDIQGLAKAMQHIYSMSPEERAQLGDKAYTRVTTQFSIPQFHAQFWQLPLVQALERS